MKAVEKWIPDAIMVIEKDIAREGSLKVDKQFNGYFASFGAAIIQSGLLPAAIFFEAEQSGAEADRKKVPVAVLHLLQKKYTEDAGLARAKKLSQYLLAEDGTSRTARLKMVSAATIALKMALRTFDLSEPATASSSSTPSNP